MNVTQPGVENEWNTLAYTISFTWLNTMIFFLFIPRNRWTFHHHLTAQFHNDNKKFTKSELLFQVNVRKFNTFVDVYLHSGCLCRRTVTYIEVGNLINLFWWNSRRKDHSLFNCVNYIVSTRSVPFHYSWLFAQMLASDPFCRYYPVILTLCTPWAVLIFVFFWTGMVL